MLDGARFLSLFQEISLKDLISDMISDYANSKKPLSISFSRDFFERGVFLVILVITLMVLPTFYLFFKRFL